MLIEKAKMNQVTRLFMGIHTIECSNTLLKKYPNEYLEKATLLTGEQYETMA